MPRFVIQEHKKQDEETHWDLMLEQGDVLKTFRLNLHPESIKGKPALAIPISDHDKRFLSYEGPVNQGLGSVQLVEQGSYSTLLQNDSTWRLSLSGTLLKGVFEIVQTQEGPWQFQQVLS
jgi:hypothetical protein